ncbi:membrane protein [Collibacillus ludicampi]|uniref:Membrane protein n=1 Tax=Collibacillus ludicampi TaxID=2771369 RepID=A0AAV4LB43_9BACL|nr:DMT family transporter [Collibacillus ludicampi]GIM44697.1 membrane protein [Collibacillus ludicampi]
MMMLAGMFIGFQSPINAALSKRVGIFESALVSFTIGMSVLLLLVLLSGKGNLREIIHAPLWEWTGGLLGAMYVTAIIVAVPRIGVSTAMIAAIAGQLLIGMIIDHFGWFGLPVREIDWRRIIAVLMMMAAVWMIFGGERPEKKQIKGEANHAPHVYNDAQGE